MKELCDFGMQELSSDAKVYTLEDFEQEYNRILHLNERSHSTVGQLFDDMT